MKPQMVIGIVMLLIAVLIALFIPCPSPIQYFICYALVGISIAFLLVKHEKGTQFKFSAYNIGVSVVGGAAIPLALFFLNPIASFKSDRCQSFARITVFVHGKKGITDMPLRGEGRVWMDVGGERKSSAIDQDGQAHFTNVQAGQNATLAIESQDPYQPVNKDSVYVIQENTSIYLKVSLAGIEKITGTVMFDSAPLDSVLVKMGDLETYSTTSGSFSMDVPEHLQKPRYDVQLIKGGFEMIQIAIYPHAERPSVIVMKKK